MITVSTLDLLAGAQVYAERGAEQGRFNIVRDNGIAAENHLHITTAYEFCYIATRACMDDGRSQYEQNLPAASACLFHLLCYFMNCQHFHFFRGDVALHKGERFALAGAFKGLDADTAMSNDDPIAHDYFVHRFTVGTIISIINDNSNIHFDAFDGYPLTMPAHLCGQVGGGIEFSG